MDIQGTLEATFAAIWQYILITGNLFAVLLLPLIIGCVALRLLGNFQEKRLFWMGGYKATLATAWIGTPVHELSHLFVALLFFRKIEKVKLFSPDPETGRLGYVAHSYRKGSIWQKIVGTPLIAIAPFFGGSLVLYGLVKLFFPEFSLSAPGAPKIENMQQPLSIESYKSFFQSVYAYFQFLFNSLYSDKLWYDGKFYLFLYLTFCVSGHMVPSKPDFRLFWKPALGFFFIFVAIVMASKSFFDLPGWLLQNSQNLLLVTNSLIYLSIFISIIGCILVYLLYSFTSMFRSNKKA